MVICITAVTFYLTGVRFHAQQAARASSYVDEGTILLADADIDSHRIFFYENADQYNTVLTKKYLIMWGNSSGSFRVPKTDDAVKLVGWCSFGDGQNHEGFTAIAVQNYDEDVMYIKMGPDNDRVVQNTPCGETTVFLWNKCIRWNDLNAVAYSVDEKPLYQLGYETENNQIITDELKWLTVE